MKRIVTLLMLLAFPILYTSCSDKDDHPLKGDMKNIIGIYKGKSSSHYLILYDNFTGVVSTNDSIEKIRWRSPSKNTFDITSSSGMIYNCNINNSSDEKFSFTFRGGIYTKAITSEKMKIDNSIVGIWKVRHSNTIFPVYYYKTEKEFEELKKRIEAQDQSFNWIWYKDDGMCWNNKSTVKEFRGEINEQVHSYMFKELEMAIEITKDFLLRTYMIDYAKAKLIPLSTIAYYIEDEKIVTGGYLDGGDFGVYLPCLHYPYILEENGMSIKYPKNYNDGKVKPTNRYIVSKYAK